MLRKIERFSIECRKTKTNYQPNQTVIVKLLSILNEISKWIITIIVVIIIIINIYKLNIRYKIAVLKLICMVHWKGEKRSTSR